MRSINECCKLRKKNLAPNELAMINTRVANTVAAGMKMSYFAPLSRQTDNHLHKTNDGEFKHKVNEAFEKYRDVQRLGRAFEVIRPI